jgi:hypothetical protein
MRRRRDSIQVIEFVEADRNAHQHYLVPNRQARMKQATLPVRDVGCVAGSARLSILAKGQ